MVDHLLINKKISVIKEHLNFLDANKKNMTAQNIKKNFSLRLEVSYSLQTLIQACIDICTHLASDEEWELPDNAGQAFKIALRHKVISSKVSEELQNAVRLRNVIVHQYDELDEKIIEDVIQHRLSIFEIFLQELKTWLKK